MRSNSQFACSKGRPYHFNWNSTVCLEPLRHNIRGITLDVSDPTTGFISLVTPVKIAET